MNFSRNGKKLCLDFNSETIRCVVGRNTKKGIVVEKNFELEMPTGLYSDGEINDMDQLSYLLTTGLQMYGVGQLDTYAVINSSKIIMREVTFPRVSREEIEGIINYQIEEYIPINPEDYVVKYLNIGSKVEDGAEKLLLMLIGIPRSTILSHLTLLKDSNLKPEILDYQGNAIGKLIASGGVINKNYPSQNTIACLEVGKESTALTIISDGIIRITRVIEEGLAEVYESVSDKSSISVDDAKRYIAESADLSIKGVEDPTENSVNEAFKESLYALLDKIEMIFRYYKTREVSNEINLILIHGELSKLNGVEKLFRDFFDLDAVVLRNLENIQIDKDLNVYANAIGGLIRHSEVKK